jgi:hypothetical protein
MASEIVLSSRLAVWNHNKTARLEKEVASLTEEVQLLKMHRDYGSSARFVPTTPTYFNAR